MHTADLLEAESDNRSKFGLRLFSARKKARLTQQEVASKVGMTQSAFARLERSGEWSHFTDSFARLLNVDYEWLAHGLKEQSELGLPEHTGAVPVYRPDELRDLQHVLQSKHHKADEYLPLMRTCPRSFAYKVEGNSMLSADGRGFTQGCYIIVDPERTKPQSGDKVLALVIGESEEESYISFKVFMAEDNRRWLEPMNPIIKPYQGNFKVLGTVIGRYEKIA